MILRQYWPSIGAAFSCVFAWFSASNTAKSSSKNANVSASVIEVTKDLGQIDFADAITFSTTCIASSGDADAPATGVAATTTANMELVSYVKVKNGLKDESEGTNGWYFGYYSAKDAKNHYQAEQISDPVQDYWRYYEIVVTIPETYTVGSVTYNIPTELTGRKFDITLNAPSNSNAFVYGLSTTIAATKVAAAPSTGGAKAASSTHKWEDLTFTAGTQKFYFGMYVDGETHTLNDNTVTGNIDVVMSADHA